jgi:LAGLIDADG-like domain
MIYMLRIERVGQYLEAITGKLTLVPNFVYASNANRRAFLEGLLDSEGWVTDTTYLRKNEIACVIGFAITSELAHEFKTMLESLGIKVGKVHTKTIPSGRVAKQMHFNTASFLDSGLTFHCWRKQRKVEGHRWARKVLEEVVATKLPDGVSLNDYEQSARKRVIEVLQAIV